MLSNEEYIRHSLELNLFFLRLEKEHIIFAAASLPMRDYNIAYYLMTLKENVERLLDKSVILANGVISSDVINSGELVTDLTLSAEEKTQFLTGLPIDTSITKRELALTPRAHTYRNDNLLQEVSNLNQSIITVTNVAIDYKVQLLNSILSCQSFSYTYPSMLHHVIEEARFYVMMLEKLENRDVIDSVKEIIEQEINWNHIMGEHARFIRGYLDPSEVKLFNRANDFSREFDDLLDRTKSLKENPDMLPEVTRESLNDVRRLRNFKKQGTEGILACQVLSIIPPLLSDHVTREANHFLRLLNSFSKMR